MAAKRQYEMNDSISDENMFGKKKGLLFNLRKTPNSAGTMTNV